MKPQRLAKSAVILWHAETYLTRAQPYMQARWRIGVSAYRRVGVSACRREAPAGSPSANLTFRLATIMTRVDRKLVLRDLVQQPHARVRLLPDKAQPYRPGAFQAQTPIRRYADTPIRRH